jgi:outer membrane immunogenic protein
MRKFIVALAASTAALTLANPAAAQDVVEDNGYNGVYVGASVGYSVQNNDIGDTILIDRPIIAGGTNAFAPGSCNGAATQTANTRCRNDQDNLEFHARIGADRQFGQGVIGIVGEFGKSQVRDYASIFSTTPASYTMAREIDWNAALRLRAGWTPNSQTLFYATGGAAYARVDHSFSTTNALNSFTVNNEEDNVWGWQAGGGVEQRLGNNFSIGLEYLYNRFDDKDSSVTVGTGAAGATNPFVVAGGATLRRSDTRFDYHSLRATAAFRF